MFRRTSGRFLKTNISFSKWITKYRRPRTNRLIIELQLSPDQYFSCQSPSRNSSNFQRNDFFYRLIGGKAKDHSMTRDVFPFDKAHFFDNFGHGANICKRSIILSSLTSILLKKSIITLCFSSLGKRPLHKIQFVAPVNVTGNILIR